ncbi:aminoacylase-1A-like isoform X1 [Danaus plexippus]|uniref:aminoacylase-1A-like isoform X1 n=1 Tax=Danaus plexippus TaxID=13037 RepID=UPI002AAF60E0|nr:aminoacylase-1A-like isoform X1 [Danaus plexippus]
MLGFVYHLYVLVSVVLCNPIHYNYTLKDFNNNPAVKKLQEYITIDSSRVENIELVVDFWKRQAADVGLSFAVYRPAVLPVCVLTLIGRQPDLPSIMLNHHGDVVPAYHSMWKYPPYSAHIDENGDLYGRGAQDTKSVGIQYIEAVRRLIKNNVTLERTLHLTVMPDEEYGGSKGIKAFILTDVFKSLNIGFALDEGFTSEDDVMLASYQDKRPVQVRFNIIGQGGHGSSLVNGSAIEKVQYLLNTALEFRKEQLKIRDAATKLDYGSYTTINVNMIEGGIAPNVIPKNISVVMDIRLATSVNAADVQAMLVSWLSNLGDDSTMEFIRLDERSPATAVDSTNPFWIAMKDTLNNRGITVTPVVLPATSDMLVLREKFSIPAIGFAPRNNMKNKIHDANEYIPVSNFLKGIDIYYDLIQKLANLSQNS